MNNTPLCPETCRADFRRALKNVPSKAFIKVEDSRLIFHVRPFNLLQFGQALNKIGLQGCDWSNAMLRHLDRNKGEFIRFVHRNS